MIKPFFGCSPVPVDVLRNPKSVDAAVRLVEYGCIAPQYYTSGYPIHIS